MGHPRTTSRTTSCAIGLLVAATIGLSGCSGDGGSDGGDTSGDSGSTSGELTTPPAAGTVLFEDALDDDRNGWALPDNEQGRTSYEGGDFVWESMVENLRPHLIATPLGEMFDAGELDMLDVVVRAEVTPTQGVAAMGVFCREVPDTDADFKWYEFVARDGFAAIRIADSAGNLEVLTSTETLESARWRAVHDRGCLRGRRERRWTSFDDGQSHADSPDHAERAVR